VLDAKVTLETHLTLPRWTDRHRANRETVLVWDTLSSDIKRHEERHAEIARQYARKLEKTLEALYPERNCQRMEAKVDATSKRIIEEHAADQQRFDRVEAASFERRMLRMLRFKAAKQNNRS
jgi:predicted secreted Zn-dependent protease